MAIGAESSNAVSAVSPGVCNEHVRARSDCRHGCWELKSMAAMSVCRGVLWENRVQRGNLEAWLGVVIQRCTGHR